MNIYWLEQSERDIPSGDWLNEGELSRWNAMRFAKRRADWRLGRWTAKRAVAAYFDLSANLDTLRTIELRPAPSGAPQVFLSNQLAAVSISLSHRSGIAAVALAQPASSLGCDLELIEPRSRGFIVDYFTPDEQSLLAGAPPEDHPALVTLLWSAKESVLKALSVGLRQNTRFVSVEPVFTASPTPGWHELSARCHDGQVFHGWWQRNGGLVRTLVSSPASTAPLALVPPPLAADAPKPRLILVS